MDLSSPNRLGQVFYAANVSAKSVIAVAAAMTGVIIYNPVGSRKNLVIADMGWTWTTAPAAIHQIGFGISPISSTLPTSVTAIGSGVKQANGAGNAGTSVTQAYDAATLAAAPVAARWIGGAVATGGTAPYMIFDHVDGALMLAPGSAGAFIALSTTAIGVGSITWIEVPV